MIAAIGLLGMTAAAGPAARKKGDKRMSEAGPFVLTCKPEVLPDKLRIAYSIRNQSAGSVYAFDSALHLEWRAPATAHVLQGIPPLPAETLVGHRIIPLAAHIAPGATLSRTLELPLPLREQSPYAGPLADDGYEAAQVNKLILGAHVIAAGAQGFEATPSPSNPELFTVRSRNTVGDAKKLECDCPIPSLRLLKRKDWYLR